MGLIDIYRILHPKKKEKNPEHIFFSSPYGTVSRIDHILGHKTSHNKFRGQNIFKHLFCPQEYETRNQPQKEKWEKNEHTKTKQHATKNQWVNDELKEEIRNA